MPRAGRLPWQCATGRVRHPRAISRRQQYECLWHGPCSAGIIIRNDEAFPRKTRRRGHAALPAHEALHRLQAPAAAQCLLAPCCLRRRARPLVRRVPGRLLPELVCGAPQRVQHAAARLLPPEPRPAARLQPRVPAPPPPPDAHRALEAPPRHGVSSRGLRPRSVRTCTVAAECPMTTRLTPKEPETYPPPRPFTSRPRGPRANEG